MYHDLFSIIDSFSAPDRILLATVVVIPVLLLVFARLKTVRRRLSTRLILAFLIVALTPVLIVIGMDQRAMLRALNHSTRQALYGAASSVSAAIDNRLSALKDTVRTESLIPDFAAYLTMRPEQRADPAVQAEITSLLQSLKRRDPVTITSYALLDVKGWDLADTNGLEIGTNKADRDYFTIPLNIGLPYVSNVFFSPATNAASIVFSSPVRDANGRMLGILRTRYDASIISNIIFQQTGLLGETSFPVLLDENLLRLADGSQPGSLPSLAGPIDTLLQERLLQERRLPNPPSAPSYSTAFAQALTRTSGEPFFQATVHGEGSPLMSVAAIRLKTQPWFLVYAQPVSEYLSVANAQLRNALSLLLATTLVVVLWAVLLARRIAGPIVRLTEATRKVASGKLDHVAVVESIDETSALARTFNDMTGRLRDTLARQELTIRNLEETRSALERSETNYRTIFTKATEGIFQCSLSGQLLTANPALAKLLGYENPEDLLAESKADFMAFFTEPDDFRLLLQRTSTENTLTNYELRLVRRDRQYLWTTFNVHIVRQIGKPDYLEGTVTDITLRKRAERRLGILNKHLEEAVRERTKKLAQKATELEEANARLQQLDAMKSAFLSSVSHELRTPLTAVLGFAKLINKDFVHVFANKTSNEQEERLARRIEANLRIIATEGERLSRLINDLLDLSKIETDHIVWHNKEVDPAQLADQALAIVASQFALNPDLKLETEIDRTLPWLFVDPDRIIQVLLNLLGNACKFTIKGVIKLQVEGSESHVHFIISDSGIGIPSTELETIFDKFHQVNQSDQYMTKPEGTGLGLAICREIVEHYRGRIFVESTLGAGSSFHVLLPIPRTQTLE